MHLRLVSLPLKSFSNCMLTIWICNDSPSFSSTNLINTIVISELTHELFKNIFPVSKYLGFFLHPPGRLPMVPSTYATTTTTSMAMCFPLGDIVRKDTIYFWSWALQTSLRSCSIFISFGRWSGVPLYLEFSRPPSIFLFLFPTFYSSSMGSQRC